MIKNRKNTEEFIIAFINKLLPGSKNVSIYKDLFSSMTDEDFDVFMDDLESGKSRLAIIAPNLSDVNISIDRNLDIAKELGHNFFEKIWMEDPNGGPNYLSNKAYLVVDLPIRRQAQLLIKKISIPEDNKSIDHMSGQPTGDSKGSKISYPELQILASLELDNSIVEFMKYRGGDLDGFTAMNDSISRTGGVSIDALSKFGTKVKSTQTLSTILTGMHLRNTLLSN